MLLRGIGLLVKLLIDEGADINAAPTNGYFAGQTPFWLAIKNGDIELFDLLINSDLDFDFDVDAQTPRWLVTKEMSLRLIEISGALANAEPKVEPVEELERIKDLAYFARCLFVRCGESYLVEYIAVLLAGWGLSKKIVTNIHKDEVITHLRSDDPVIFRSFITSLCHTNEEKPQIPTRLNKM